MFPTATFRRTALAVSVLLAIGCLAAALQAQTADTPDVFAFETFTAANGLPHDVVYGLAQDRSGFVWVATQEGLARFDGRQFTVFRHDPANPESLAIDNISNLLVDRRGELWVATWGGGLDRFDRETERFQHVGVAEEARVPDLRVQTVFEDRRGQLWLGCFTGGLVRFDRDTGAIETVPWALPVDGGGRVWALADDAEGRLWIATDAGVGILQPGNDMVDPPPTEATNPLAKPARTLLIMPDESLLVGTESGLVRRDPSGRIEVVPLGAKRRAEEVINALAIDRWQRLWVSTSGGLVRLDPPYDSPQRYLHDPNDSRSLASDDVRRLVVGRGDVLWIATRGGGLSRMALEPPLFHHVEAQPSVPGALGNGHVLAFAEPEPGDLWVATARGAYRRTESGFEPFQPISGSTMAAAADTINALAVDSRAQLWFGTWRGGLCRLDDRAAATTTCFLPDPSDPDAISSDRIWRLYSDSDDGLWIAHRDGADRADLSGSEPRFMSLPTLDDLVVRVFWEDRRGDVWIGTDQHGLGRWRRGRSEVDMSGPGRGGSGLSSARVQAILEDRTGQLWVGTDRGLDRRQGQRFEPFPNQSLLPGKSVVSLASDLDGFLWLGTEAGLARVDPETDEVRIYDARDGLPSTGFTNSSVLRDHRGHLLFGGFDGYVDFDPSRLASPTPPPPLLLTRFQIAGGQPAVAPHTVQSVVLEPGEDSFVVEYAALNVGTSKVFRLRHRLAGFDRQWVLSEDGRASYARVDPGRYVFRAQVAGRDGRWSEQGLALDIELRPPIWATLWFRIGAVLVVLGLLTGVYRMRVGRLRRREQELQERVEAALAELRDSGERIRRAQKLESLAVLAGGVAHDFNNLLTGVLGQIDLVRLDLPKSEHEAHLALDRAVQAAERAAHLSTQMLAYSGQGAFEVEGLDLSALVRQLSDTLDELFQGEANPARLELRLVEGLPAIRADAGQIAQLLEALVSNARDAGARQIEVSTEQCILEQAGLERLLFHDWVRPGRFVELRVRDDGDGLAGSEWERLFDPFFSTRGPGRGLGLAVVLGIVRGHGGALQVESELGMGTSVRVLLPIDAAQR